MFYFYFYMFSVEKGCGRSFCLLLCAPLFCPDMVWWYRVFVSFMPTPKCVRVPLQASSRIIGRGGAFIKQLQRESGCKINTLKEVELRSGLTARVMNVCGNNTSMSKGLYLIARKIASRWEYAPEWEGGDPTATKGQGLPPPNLSASSAKGGGGGGSRGGGGPGAPEPPPFDAMDVDGRSTRRGQRGGGQRSNRRGERDEHDDHGHGHGRGDRDGGGGGRSSDRRGSGSSHNGGERGGGRESRYGRGGGGGGGRDGPPVGPSSGGGGGGGGQQSHGSATPSSPWTDPAILASVVGASTAAAGTPSAAASAEAWQRLLGQIPSAARESLGISAAQVAAGMPATDVYGQILRGAQAPQQLQQAPQVRYVVEEILLYCGR